MKAFVFGIGGGGDVVSAIVAYNYLRKLGYDVLLGSVVWERYVEDPIPGPICFDNIRNGVLVNQGLYKVNRDTYAIRGNRRVVPQLVRAVRALNLGEAYGICNKDGVIGLYSSLKEFVNKEKIDLIVGVDAGGDVLAKGCEETLGSPLIDFISLASLVKLEEDGYNVMLGVIGSGSDGELQYDYFLKRISEIASLNGLLDIKGYDRETANLVGRILNEVTTEASKIPFDAFKGLYGEITIRNGTRKVLVTPISAVMFFLDPIKIAETSPLYSLVKDSISIDDAKKNLNEVGIYTEYNFEEDLYNEFGLNASHASAYDVDRIRVEGKRKLGGVKIKC
ncbi:DUF1152 domain-containing protein [Saccharolobus solfataricus]|uniref:DUF1152 domain-containing protein n=3 Tax=Saccharolobus solfataricus TaxID=2287 RepID=Q97W66_SACS2|nr:DUF1152 domain-containing protein [Saccharolobus solfataricus]AAK42522.1 Conserved hypothetical protein [Saccharolobus solfataricus P2]AKA72619.1 DUF1152 domain-containing protein [Saccharolobus solfataricus]AKA75318.1 DUF1152 domain-containing protein [Saccharolobus solfataricus]AKA78011.1 DUF1152 domain-containing protein [Saccharolobus solfataricus]AZF67130.1 DUF1152 domain-containing protein [Saccharolobus solfataricus]